MSKLRYSTIANADLSSTAKVDGTVGALCTMSMREYYALAGQTFRCSLTNSAHTINVSLNTNYNVQLRTGTKRVIITDLTLRSNAQVASLALYANCTINSNGSAISPTGSYSVANVNQGAYTSRYTSVYFGSVVSNYGTLCFSSRATVNGANTPNIQPFGQSIYAVLNANTVYVLNYFSKNANSEIYDFVIEFIEL